MFEIFSIRSTAINQRDDRVILAASGRPEFQELPAPGPLTRGLNWLLPGGISIAKGSIYAAVAAQQVSVA